MQCKSNDNIIIIWSSEVMDDNDNKWMTMITIIITIWWDPTDAVVPLPVWVFSYCSYSFIKRAFASRCFIYSSRIFGSIYVDPTPPTSKWKRKWRGGHILGIPVLLHRTSNVSLVHAPDIRPIERFPDRTRHFLNFRCKGAVCNRRTGIWPWRPWVWTYMISSFLLLPCALSFLTFWVYICLSEVIAFVYSNGL